jgi:hypothetical protein
MKVKVRLLLERRDGREGRKKYARSIDEKESNLRTWK